MPQPTSIHAHGGGHDAITAGGCATQSTAGSQAAKEFRPGRRELTRYLVQYAFERTGIDLVDLNAPVTALGVDSVEWVTLVCELEQWIERPLHSDFLDGVDTLQQLVDKLLQLLAAPGDPPESAAGRNSHGLYADPCLTGTLERLKLNRVFVRARGSYLYEEDGVEYLDFSCELGALPFGHHPREIWDALAHLQAQGEPVFCEFAPLHSAGKLAQRLLALAPMDMSHVMFANSGEEALETACLLARRATGRTRVLTAASPETIHHEASASTEPQAVLSDTIMHGDVVALELELRGAAGHVAAIVVEPALDHVAAPRNFLRACKELCERYGALLIVNEVQTGLGRTGEFFACCTEDVHPDMLILGDALGGGIATLGACLCGAALPVGTAMKDTAGLAGNALAARAALASLDLLLQDRGVLLHGVRDNGQYLLERLRSLQQRYPWLIDAVSGRGFMLNVRLSSTPMWPENYLALAAGAGKLGQLLASYLLNVERVRLAPALRHADVLCIRPPLNATRAQCVHAADAIERTIEMLAHGHTGNFFRALLQRTRPPIPPAAPPRIGDSAAVAEPSFAFLLHPSDAQSYADYDPTLTSLAPHELEQFANSMAGWLGPQVGSTAHIESPRGTRVRGDFILLSHTAEQLRAMPAADALQVLHSALQLARSRGAQLAGLGAYTSVVSSGGALLQGCGLPLTSGNSYTVVAAIEALDLCIANVRQSWSSLSGVVVGAAGAIGSCVAMLLAERVPRLVLVGNAHDPQHTGRARLLEVAERICRHVLASHREQHACGSGSLAAEILALALRLDRCATPAAIVKQLEFSGLLSLSLAPQAVSLGDVVVCATSAPRNPLHPSVFRYGAIVCDISRPRSVALATQAARGDILVVDGGVIAVPGGVCVGPYGIAPGTAYACMAETMLLALEGEFQHRSLGSQLSIHDVRHLQSLARKHGFVLAHLQSFGKPIAAEAWARYAACRERERQIA